MALQYLPRQKSKAVEASYRHLPLSRSRQHRPCLAFRLDHPPNLRSFNNSKTSIERREVQELGEDGWEGMR